MLAFDVGATDLKAALVDDAGSIRDIVWVPTPIDGDFTAGAVVTRIGELARDLLEATATFTAATGVCLPRPCHPAGLSGLPPLDDVISALTAASNRGPASPE